jgi:hypothetical protein
MEHGMQGPPQSTSVSPTSFVPSPQGGHIGQLPPQSIPFSLPFFTPSLHVGVQHRNGMPRHTLLWQSPA